MPLFTALLEFDGGTYISQLRSTSPSRAAKKYAAQLVTNEALGTLTLRKRLATAVSGEKPVAVNGVRNVWCCAVSVGNKLALLNIIQTNDDTQQ
jgi:hypothetical protein